MCFFFFLVTRRKSNHRKYIFCFAVFVAEYLFVHIMLDNFNTGKLLLTYTMKSNLSFAFFVCDTVCFELFIDIAFEMVLIKYHQQQV